MKRILIITVLVVIMLVSSCIKKETSEPEPVKPDQILLSQIGTEGKLTHNESAYEILEMNNFDLWVLYLKKDKLTQQIKSSNSYTAIYNNLEYTLKQNPFNHNILKLLLPTHLKPEESKNIIIKAITARENGKIKNDIDLAIEKIYITKVTENATTLNEISVEDYTDLYGSGPDNFAYDGDQFIRPSHVKSNEENAYEVDTYFDARTVATTESATGAFQFLKDVDHYETYIIMENPNRFRVTGGSTELLEPDDRWRIRQLGQEGELNRSPVFNIIDDETNQQFILSIDKDTLPATYNGTFFWITQFKEATETLFDQTEQSNIFTMTIPYTTAPSREIVLNSRFTGIVDRIIRVNETGEYQGSYQVLNTAIADATNKDRIKIAGDTVLSPTNEQAEIAGEIEINDKELTITTFTGTNATLDWEESGKGFSLTNHASLSLNRLNIINCKNEEPNEAAAINMSEFSVLNVNHTLLASNTGDMGAIYATENSRLTIKNASITNNVGTNLLFGTIIVHGARLNVTDSYFASNSAKGPGGGLCIVSSVDATIKGTEFINNCAGENGAGISVTDDSVVNIDDCFFEGNSFTSNEETDHFGAGIFINTTFLRNQVTGSTFKNMEAQKGAGIYIQDGELTLYDNSFEDLETKAGGAVFIGEKVESGHTLFNREDKTWKWFNVPDSTVEFVENSSSDNNTYIRCTLNGDETAEGAKICHIQRTTPNGNFALRPENGDENLTVTLNIDYLIGREFHGGSLTVDVPAGFQVTDNASVAIGENAATPASVYAHTVQSIDITDIDLEEGTITLRLEEQNVPDGGEPETVVARDLDYTFSAISDADGTSVAWEASGESQAVFTSQYVSTNTAIQIMGETDYMNLIYDTTDEATKIKYATGTTVASLTSRLESTDGSEQGYTIETPEGPLSSDATFPEAATLTVTSAWGEEYTQSYTIYSCDVKLTVDDNTITWYTTVQDAIDAIGTDETGVIEIYRSEVIKGSQIVIDNKEVTIKPNEVFVDVTFDGNEAHRVFYITNGASVTMNNLHITRGTTITGAGLRVDDSRLTMEKCRVDSNHATTVESGNKGRGGGILGHESTLRFFNTTFASNTADGSGGGLRISVSTVEIANSTITSNESSSFLGGGIYLTYSDVSITNVLVTFNSGTYGGGLFDNASIIDIVESKFSSNESVIYGGAIYSAGSTITIQESLIDSNYCNLNGGGGIAFQGSNATVTESTITQNTTNKHGGGIAIFKPLNLPAPVKTITLHSNVITDNTAAEKGGGVYIEIIDNSLCPEPLLLNADGAEWKKYNAPTAEIPFIEHNTTEASNNTYSGNSAATNEGEDIYYDYETIPQTPAGTLTVSPSESAEGDPDSISLDFKTAAYLRSASLTVHIPDEFGLTSDNASVTFEGNTQTALDYGAQTGQNPFTIDVPDADPDDVLTISFESTPTPPAGNYTFQVFTDADGAGTAWALSEEASDQLVSSSAGNFIVEYEGYSDVSETFQGAVDMADSTKPSIISINIDTVTSEHLPVDIGGKEITIRPAAGKDSITIDGGGTTNALNIISDGASVTLEDLEIINCKSDKPAIYVEGATLTVNRCVFDGNESASYHGGAIYLNDFSDEKSDLIIQNSTFTNNINSNAHGGAVYSNDSQTITITDSTFTANTASKYGGALYFWGDDEVFISKCSISDNLASTFHGGGLGFNGISSLKIENCSIKRNIAAGDQGGGIYLIGDNTSAKFQSVMIQDNQSENEGGGVYANIEYFTLNESTIVNNTTGMKGGGVYINHSNLESATLTDNDFISNETTSNTIGNVDGGGALYITYTAAYVSIFGNTFTDNNVSHANSRGGAIWFDSNGTIRNSNDGTWESSSSPASETYEVEGVAAPGDNTYSGNTINGATDTTGAVIYCNP